MYRMALASALISSCIGRTLAFWAHSGTLYSPWQRHTASALGGSSSSSGGGGGGLRTWGGLGRCGASGSQSAGSRTMIRPESPLGSHGGEDGEALRTTPRANKLLRAPPKFNPTPFQYLEEVELHIESLTNMGDGVARIDGWVVMVPHTIPGETVVAKVHRNHKNYSEATLSRVVKANPDRVEPRCKYFGLCGGCQYQHMTIESQRSWKREQVVDVLERIAGLEGAAEKVGAPVGSDMVYGYRSKLTPHYDRPKDGFISHIGFRRVNFPSVFYGKDLAQVDVNRVVDIEDCPIAVDSINEKLPEVRAKAQEQAMDKHLQVPAKGETKKKPKGATVLLRQVKEGVVTDPTLKVTEEVLGREFQFIAGEFFQVSPFVLPMMVEHVVKQASQGGARFLIDAYCGGGLFCISAARSFERCAGIEISPQAISNAAAAATLNNITNCLFLAGTASDIFASVTFDPKETVVIIDPPRKGCDDDFLSQLVNFGPGRLVYVSCDPSTQARDTAYLLEHGYQVQDITPFDLFPQTRHIENVITFDKRA